MSNVQCEKREETVEAIKYFNDDDDFEDASEALLCAFFSGNSTSFHRWESRKKSETKHRLSLDRLPLLCFRFDGSIVRFSQHSGICQCSNGDGYIIRCEHGIWRRERARERWGSAQKTAKYYYKQWMLNEFRWKHNVELQKKKKKRTFTRAREKSQQREKPFHLLWWNKFPYKQQFFSPFFHTFRVYLASSAQLNLGIGDGCLPVCGKEWSLTNIANATDKLALLDFLQCSLNSSFIRIVLSSKAHTIVSCFQLVWSPRLDDTQHNNVSRRINGLLGRSLLRCEKTRKSRAPHQKSYVFAR